jgi:transcriptional regulator with XRE-family HTH domain
MRAEMGRDLARRRRAAGLSQEQLAALTGEYSRATVSHAEGGNDDVGRGVWQAIDRVLGTGGLFVGLYDETRESLAPGRRTAVRAGGTGIRCEFVLKAAEPDKALAGYRRLGWPVAARGDVLELLAGKSADVLEVGHVAGEVAAVAWLESGGSEGAVRGLPRLPAPDGSLAVVEAGEHWFFLVRPGFPWPAGPRPAAGEAEIRWHSVGSRVRLPPSKAGQAAARWAHLPVAVLDLAPPLAVLDLLGWAVAMTHVRGRLRLPGGAVVAPADPLP